MESVSARSSLEAKGVGELECGWAVETEDRGTVRVETDDAEVISLFEEVVHVELDTPVDLVPVQLAAIVEHNATGDVRRTGNWVGRIAALDKEFVSVHLAVVVDVCGRESRRELAVWHVDYVVTERFSAFPA